MTLIVGLMCFVSSAAAKDVTPPPNADATAGWDAAKGELTLQYHGVEILHAIVTAKDTEGKSVAVKLDSKTVTPEEQVEQTLTFSAVEAKEGTTLVLSGTVTGSEEAFPAEADSDAQNRFPMVRNSVGLARFNWREISRHWSRGDRPAEEIRFSDLGLSDQKEYLIYEFWSRRFLGRCEGSFTAPAQDPNNGLRVFAIREAREHPWVVSTTRHISQGAVSLSDVQWDANAETLSGASAVVVGDPYVPTVHLPEGFRLASAEIDGKKAEIANQEQTATVRIVPSKTGRISWKMNFNR